ncbi:hypothetical protein UJ101_02458 [Flavobacteriaceae bacterium UJ101]|nr:hypothetical protein UJ101_02458 [Flavobacteriaceae bacterium UJ101]
MLVFVIIVGSAVTSNSDAQIDEASIQPINMNRDMNLSALEEAEQSLQLGEEYLYESPENPNRRTYAEYMENRAYEGAPPYIPHEVESDLLMGGKECLQCHENGGYVAEFKNFAPTTPHPTYVNCRQCHVPINTQKLFVENDFKPIKVDLNNNALLTSPPTMPHSLQLRSNCLACHAGPAVPKEILTDHPERANCLQCHALNGVEKDQVPSWHRTKNK